MTGAARQNVDQAGLCGTIITGSYTVFINNLPAARVGDLCQRHGRGKHGRINPIVTGSSSVIVEGRQLAKAGSLVCCGCPVNICSYDVFVGG